MTTDLHPFANAGRTKLALVSHGVALPEGLPHSSRYLAQVNATEHVLDLKLASGHFCSVPVGQPYTEKSAFSLHFDDGEPYLLCGGERCDVDLQEVPSFYHQRTRQGARMGSFASLHDRLLKLNPFLGCGFFTEKGMACGYCQYDSMMNQATPPMRDPLELIEVVHAALNERAIDTVYLYSGYAAAEDAGLSRLVPLIALLRKHLGSVQIALETVAPRDTAVVEELYTAGLDIFICNLEVNDAQRFAEVCPGKEKHGGQEAVLAVLEHARQFFRAGTLVSHLIVGLEPIASTEAGMRRLVDMGIVPLLIPFRPLPGSALEDQQATSLDDMEQALLTQYELLHASALPMHRLRDMGRVLTPMEGRVLLGGKPMLQDRLINSGMGRRLGVWLDHFRRYAHSKAADDELAKEQIAYRSSFRLLLDEILPFLALLGIGLTMMFFSSMPAPEGLSDQGWQALLVFFLCLSLWVTQLLPLAVTSLLGLALLPVLQVMPAAAVFSLFGNPAVFFILGAFMLVVGVRASGLSERLAVEVLLRNGHSPRRLLLAMLFLPALMACVMPEHAVAALLLPVVWELVRSLNLRQQHPYAQGLFFAMAWGAIIGGVMTLLGGARGPLALALSSELTGQSFSFSDWTLAAFPVVLPTLAVAAALLWRLGSIELDMTQVLQRMQRRRLELGLLSIKAYFMAVLMLCTIFAWVFFGHADALASIALVSVVLMFALRLARWKDIESQVSWGVVLMYGGAIAVGKALSDTGAAIWLAQTLIPGDLLGLALLACLLLLTLFLTEGVSNAAAVAIVLPIAIPLAVSADLNPVGLALMIGIIAGFAFMLPMGTPPNAMIYATGYIRSNVMLRYGACLSLTAFVSCLLAMVYWWPRIGFDMGVG